MSRMIFGYVSFYELPIFGLFYAQVPFVAGWHCPRPRVRLPCHAYLSPLLFLFLFSKCTEHVRLGRWGSFFGHRPIPTPAVHFIEIPRLLPKDFEIQTGKDKINILINHPTKSLRINFLFDLFSDFRQVAGQPSYQLAPFWYVLRDFYQTFGFRWFFGWDFPKRALPMHPILK